MTIIVLSIDTVVAIGIGLLVMPDLIAVCRKFSGIGDVAAALTSLINRVALGWVLLFVQHVGKQQSVYATLMRYNMISGAVDCPSGTCPPPGKLQKLRPYTVRLTYCSLQ